MAVTKTILKDAQGVMVGKLNFWTWDIAMDSSYSGGYTINPADVGLKVFYGAIIEPMNASSVNYRAEFDVYNKTLRAFAPGGTEATGDMSGLKYRVHFFGL